ncbi:MAG: hypothetical protein QXX71_01965 [Candidatus Nanoarchaeia archaeon]|nr:hypothetical protein [Candidatus Haiyanarchaeum thermophilum]MCW1308074.1 hypothetical protein [Candidatus Haiyanarchaeum thermophilum]
MKAQGLPINTIVLAILALLVLVILAAVFVPGFRSLITSILSPAPTSIEQFTSLCTDQYCKALDDRYEPGTLANLKYSDWCTKELQVYDPSTCVTKDRCFEQGEQAGNCVAPIAGDFGGTFSSTNAPEKVKLKCSFRLRGTGKVCNPTNWEVCCENPSELNCNCA